MFLNLSKKIVLTLILGILSFAFPTLAQENDVAEVERVKDFRINLIVEDDGSLDITETIIYDFAGNVRHGIYRNIPLREEDYSVTISNISVTDENGNLQTIQKTYNSGYNGYRYNWINLRIGDENITFDGEKTYIVRYRIERAVKYLENYDRLYWDLIGDQWEVPIEKAEAFVSLPREIKREGIDLECFLGAFGSTEECSAAYILEAGRTILHFHDLRPLEAQEALTVALNFPKGVVSEPTAWDNFWYFIKLNPLLFLPLFLFFFLYRRWLKKGKDPKKKTIIAQYDVPSDLRPIEVGVIVDGVCHNRDLTAGIIYLATKGYLKIVQEDKKEYVFEKLKSGDDLENYYDQKLFKLIFSSKSKDKVELSDLKSQASAFLALRNEVFERLVSKKIFANNPQRVRVLYFVMAGLLFFPIFPLAGFYHPALNMLGLFLSSMLFVVFAFIMPKMSEAGMRLKEYLLGLKLYLEVAEKDRLKFHNAPEKKPEHFEKLLPFAMALKVEKQWAEKFEDVCREPLKWYEGQSGAFNALVFSQALSGFSSSFNGAVFVSHSSSGGGGGFSGGGGGGGGGGSW